MTMPARFVVLGLPIAARLALYCGVQPFNLAGFYNRSNPAGSAA
jgi:hypothetical protein